MDAAEHAQSVPAASAPGLALGGRVILADDPPGLNGNGYNPESSSIHAGLRARVNLVNGSTLAGLGVAALGGARVTRSPDRLFVGTGYRLPVPPAPAFCLGNVIITRMGGLTPVLFRHEARHATQYACCGGVLMVPLYLVAAAASWVLTGDTGCETSSSGGPAWPTAATPTSRCGPLFRACFECGLAPGQ